MVNWAVRWNTVRCPACSAITGMAWMPDAPVPIDPDPLAGEVHRLVRPVAGVQRPPGEAVSAPGNTGLLAVGQAPHRGDQVPGSRRSVPSSVRTVHASRVIVVG